jgi:hypothetical protein
LATRQGFITNIEAENLRRTERSVLLAREKYEVDKVLENVNLSNSFNLCISSLRLINGLLRLSAVVLALLVTE